MRRKNSVQRSGKPHLGGGGGGNSSFFKKTDGILEINKRQRIVVFLCLFVCSQIAHYQQGYFGLIADCFGLNLINISSNQKSRNLQTSVWLGGKSFPTAYKKLVQRTLFDRKCLNQHPENPSHICYNYESYANVEVKDHPIVAS